MTNAMTWDAIAANEGSAIESISATEADEVSGGWVWFAVSVAVAIVRFPRAAW